MKQSQDHSVLVTKGVALHNQFKYAEALPLLKRAYNLAPQCPATVYNLANTLQMLGREKKSLSLLTALVQTPSDVVAQSCPDLRAPQSFQVDAYYLLFNVILFSTRSWKKAIPYAQKHLALRRRGSKSAWTVRQIRREIRELETEWKP